MGPVLTCTRVKCFPKNKSLSPDYAMMLVSHFQVWRNCAPDGDRVRLDPQKL